MINAAWTLLLNLDAATYTPSPLGHVVAPGYTAVAAPSDVQALRRILYGAQPDGFMLEYRTRQLLQAAQVTDFAEHFLRLDTRLTYDPWAPPALFQTPPSSRQLTGASGTVYFQSDPRAPDYDGITTREYIVDLGATEAIVRFLVPPRTSETIAITRTSGTSSAVPLRGSGYAALFGYGPGDRWHIRTVQRPQRDLGDLVRQVEQEAGLALTALFYRTSPKGQQEPVLSWRRAWEEADELPLRVAALCLGMIERTEERRRGQI